MERPESRRSCDRKCRWTCESCHFEFNNDWVTECQQCSTPAPLSARRIGVKLRGIYYFCTLSQSTTMQGHYGNEVGAVCVRSAQSYKFTVARDARPIEEQLAEGLDRAVHGKKMASTIKVINENLFQRPNSARGRLEAHDDGPSSQWRRGAAAFDEDLWSASEELAPPLTARTDSEDQRLARQDKERKLRVGSRARGLGGTWEAKLWARGDQLRSRHPGDCTEATDDPDCAEQSHKSDRDLIAHFSVSSERDALRHHFAMQNRSERRRASGPQSSHSRALKGGWSADSVPTAPTSSPVPPLGAVGNAGSVPWSKGLGKFDPSDHNQLIDLDQLRTRAQHLPVKDNLHRQRSRAKARSRDVALPSTKKPVITDRLSTVPSLRLSDLHQSTPVGSIPFPQQQRQHTGGAPTGERVPLAESRSSILNMDQDPTTTALANLQAIIAAASSPSSSGSSASAVHSAALGAAGSYQPLGPSGTLSSFADGAEQAVGPSAGDVSMLSSQSVPSLRWDQKVDRHGDQNQNHATTQMWSQLESMLREEGIGVKPTSMDHEFKTS